MFSTQLLFFLMVKSNLKIIRYIPTFKYVENINLGYILSFMIYNNCYRTLNLWLNKESYKLFKMIGVTNHEMLKESKQIGNEYILRYIGWIKISKTVCLSLNICKATRTLRQAKYPLDSRRPNGKRILIRRSAPGNTRRSEAQCNSVAQSLYNNRTETARDQLDGSDDLTFYVHVLNKNLDHEKLKIKIISAIPDCQQNTYLLNQRTCHFFTFNITNLVFHTQHQTDENTNRTRKTHSQSRWNVINV
ncbi:hypothetical protein AGLY_015719 [Aphis glycines]|uniref:Uncharacterized protein n=1 Tax=Aphis glycines TaxID=307491 RepID=A0A6G0T1N3_APHGL|nr:hypothetical protein AGLY_015719 [Aphis glycines]